MSKGSKLKGRGGQLYTSLSSTLNYAEKFIFAVLTPMLLYIAPISYSYLSGNKNHRLFWTNVWEMAHKYFNGDPFAMAVYGTSILITATYLIVGAAYLSLDMTGKPKCLIKYKIQPTKNNPMNMSQLKALIKLAGFNLVFVSGVPGCVGFYYLMRFRGCQFSLETPSIFSNLSQMIIFVLAEEIFFYYFHRLFHHPKLYKYIHKRHHEWTAPVALAAFYAHPVEHVIANILPPLLGPLLMQCHIATFWMWITLAIAGAMTDHSGYHFPFLTSPEFHDYHHYAFEQNYGLIGFLDWIHGTDKQFKASKAYQRHRLIYDFIPARKAIPDTK